MGPSDMQGPNTRDLLQLVVKHTSRFTM